MAISSEEVIHVARLARLDLTAEEVELFRGQLDVVLERAQRLQSLPIDDLEPTGHPAELRNVLRDDEVTPNDDHESILNNAPHREGVFFAVPRILEEDV